MQRYEEHKTKIAISVILILAVCSFVNIYMAINSLQTSAQQEKPIKAAINSLQIEYEIPINTNELDNVKIKQKQVVQQQKEQEKLDIKIDGKEQPKIQFIEQINRQTLTQQEIDSNSLIRAQMGQPKLLERNMRFWVIQGFYRNPTCAIINGINILTPNIKTIPKSIFSQAHIGSIILITDRTDKFAHKLIHETFSKNSIQYYDLEFDSQYKFIRSITRSIKCQWVLYMHHNFVIKSAQMLYKQMSLVRDLQVYFSLSAVQNETQIMLADLSKTNLQELHASQFSKYIYIFNQKYLHLITPLNFAYYIKYTLEEMIVLPILAFSQKFNTLIPFQGAAHSFNESHIQYKQFSLQPLSQESDSICFVSYPSDPFKQSIPQLSQYLKNLKRLNVKDLNISIIIFLPYKYTLNIYGQNGKQFLQNLVELTQSKYKRVRLQIRANKTVSSLSAYEAAYTHCPYGSLIVSSRHNVQFKSNFAKSINAAFTTKSYYYVANFIDQTGSIVIFEKEKLEQFKGNLQIYETYYSPLQIFKSNLLKSYYFWGLKSAQVDFYETQASFVLSMLQMINFKVIAINQTLFKVYPRQRTQKQKEQLKNIKKYHGWTTLNNNELKPFPYNCLKNQAFRRYAVEKIPPIIHQVWLKEEVPAYQQKLFESVKKTNPQFTVTIWRKENITYEKFPLTHSLISRTFSCEKQLNKSFQPLICSLIAYQAIYKYGGVYMDRKVQGLKSIKSFLKYEIFFTSPNLNGLLLSNYSGISYQIMGAIQHNYYLHFALTELVSQNQVNYNNLNLMRSLGQQIIRKSLNDEQLFISVGFGFYLFGLKFQTDELSECDGQRTFLFEQQIFDIYNQKKEKISQIGFPCKNYPQLYVLVHKFAD